MKRKWSKWIAATLCAALCSGMALPGVAGALALEEAPAQNQIEQPTAPPIEGEKNEGAPQAEDAKPNENADAPQPQEIAEKTSLRVGTFNIAATKAPDIAAQAKLVDDNGIDVIGLQEVDVNTTRNQRDMLADFVAGGAMEDSLFQKAITMKDGVGEYGIGIASKTALTEKTGGALDSTGVDEARAYAKAVVTVGDKKVALYNTHLTWDKNVENSVAARARQIAQLKEAVAADNTPYKVITGDFNIDQTHDEFYAFLDTMNMANGGMGTWYDTFNGTDSTMKTKAIDNIITTRNIAVSNVTMVETTLSDHNLFYADLELLTQEQPSRQLLDLLVTDAAGYAESEYSADSFAALTAAVAAARAVAADATQATIDAATEALRAAVDGLAAPTQRMMNIAVGKPVTVSGCEVTDGRFPAAGVTDGVTELVGKDTKFRWSAEKKDDQWCKVDLGTVQRVKELNLMLWAESPDYEVFVSADDTDYVSVLKVTDGSHGSTVTKKIVLPQVTDVRYIKYQQNKMWKHTNNNFYGSSITELEVFSPDYLIENGNPNIALGKTTAMSGCEFTDGTHHSEKAVDGITNDKDSRWSPDKDTSKRAHEAWMTVDLGAIYNVQQINTDFESEAHKYELLTSVDGTTYTEFASATPTTEGEKVLRKFSTPEPVQARYIKYHQTEQWYKAGIGRYYGGSLYELEIYQQASMLQTAQDVLDALGGIAPTVSQDGTKLVLPDAGNENYTLTLYGSDNRQVLDMSGNIHKPLVDMPVNVLYKVTRNDDATQFATSAEDIKITIPGTTQKGAGDNARPNVVPGLREWKGAEGDFALTGSSAIVLEAASADALAATAATVQQYFSEMLGRTIAVKTGTPAAGDIALKLDASLAYLGTEGYTLDSADVFTIASSAAKGVLYGGISLTQVLYQEDTHTKFPKGQAHDYPKYEVRAGMLDVGRVYIPLDYVQEMASYMAWFKLNEIQMHINDYWGNSKYSAFRLESTTYPEIVAKDGHYTKEQYKQFQKNLTQYGIDVVTEIDSPYHAECFRAIEGAPMKAAGQLDIRTDETYAKSVQIIKNLMDEYLDGDDPVFQGNKYHIGTDEYDKGASEQMRKFTDELIRYTNGKGRETRVWGSLGSKGFNGTTPVSNEATVNLWAPYWADVKETYAAGFNVVNTCGGWLYIVPRSNAGYPDRIKLDTLYDQFEVNNFSPNRQPGNGTAIMPVAHPQTKGASFAVWNDMTSFRGGYTEFDIYDRFKNAVAIVSEKTWYGENDADQTGADFVARFAKVDDKAPGSNAGRFVTSKADLIANIDFENGGNDKTENGYNAALTGDAQVVGDAGRKSLKLSGAGALELPMDSVGYPYTVKMDVKLAADTPANTLLFSGKDGEFFANIDGTGFLGFKRGYHPGTQNVGYTFVYDKVTLPADRWVALALTCDPSKTTLYLDGKAQVKAVMTAESRNNGFQVNKDSYNDSSTFILPVEQLGKNMKGELDDLLLYNRVLTAAEIAALTPEIPIDPNEPVNVAFEKPATASSVFPDQPWTADKAVDGINDWDTTKNSRWSSLRTGTVPPNGVAGEYGETNQWLKVDLGQTRYLDKVSLFWEGAFATHYKIMGSLNDIDYTELKDVNATKAGLQTHENLGNKAVRYLKIDCLTPKTARYGYSIFELEAYEGVNAKVLQAVLAAEIELATMNVGTGAGQIAQTAYDAYVTALTEIKTLAMGATMTDLVIAEKLAWITDQMVALKTCLVAKPAAPAKPTVSAGDSQLAVSWTAPADGYSAITGYTLKYTDGKTEKTVPLASVLTHNLTGLTNGTAYTVSVCATNAIGSSAYSETATGAPYASSSDDWEDTPQDKPVVETKPDGSVITTVTDKKTGTVTKTSKKSDGTVVTEQTKKDGTVTTTETTKDNVKTETVTTPAGEITAKVTLPSGKDSATVTVPVLTPAAGQVAVIVNADGTKTIVPKSAITENGVQLTVNGSVTIQIIDNGKSFADMNTAAWAADAVAFVTARELFSGTGSDRFDPNALMNRGMLVTVLHRLEGKPSATGDNAFSDVAQDAYYAAAALWASQNGIVTGTEKGFEPDGAITREQLAVMLYRYAGSPATKGTQAQTFADSASIADYAVSAIQWAVENGILTGKDATTLDPNGSATRAEVATMLQRYISKIAQ